MAAAFEDRTAVAQCIFTFVFSDTEEPVLFVGQCQGKIVEPRGENKFGWDPVFQPEQPGEKTFSELTPEEKNKVSHRGNALEKLVEYFKTNNGENLTKLSSKGDKKEHKNEVKVKGLAFKATEADIRKLFETWGDISSINLLSNRLGESKGVAFVRYANPEAVTKAESQSGLEFMERKIWIERTDVKVERNDRNMKSRSTDNYNNRNYGGGYRNNNFRNNDNYNNNWRDNRDRRHYNNGWEDNQNKRWNRGGQNSRDRGNYQDQGERNDDLSIFVGNLNYDTTEQTLRNFFESCGAVKDVRLGKKPNGRSKGFAHVEFEKIGSVKKAMALKDSELDGRQLNVDQSRYRDERRNNNYRQGGY